MFPLEISVFYGIGKIIAIYFESKAKYVYTYMEIHCGGKNAVFLNVESCGGCCWHCALR